MPKCQKIKKGGLYQYGAECFGRLIFATIRKCGTERVNLVIQVSVASVFLSFSL